MIFCIALYREQMKCGWYFIHERLAGAESRVLDAMRKLVEEHGVLKVTADICMFGLMTWCDGGGSMPAKKPTSFPTKVEVSRQLQRRCDGSHEHQALINGRAAAAQEYTAELCKAICRGVKAQKKVDSLGLCAVGIATLEGRGVCRIV